MKHVIHFRGYRPGTGKWNHFSWDVVINGELFEYKTGSGHAFRGPSRPKKPCVRVPELDVWAHIPEIDDVLECLFSDADIGSRSFYDFCSELGYSNDSLSAMATYLACCTTAERLRKALGAEYQKQQERLENRHPDGWVAP